MIDISPSASREINRLKAKQNNPHLYLRLGIQQSGCCGLSYTVAFEQAISPEDTVYDGQPIALIIETKWLNYLDGLTIDYSEDLMGGGFRFQNPQATQTCSCGQSFAFGESVTII